MALRSASRSAISQFAHRCATRSAFWSATGALLLAHLLLARSSSPLLAPLLLAHLLLDPLLLALLVLVPLLCDHLLLLLHHLFLDHLLITLCFATLPGQVLLAVLLLVHLLATPPPSTRSAL
jgi:hypothetical protein